MSTAQFPGIDRAAFLSVAQRSSRLWGFQPTRAKAAEGTAVGLGPDGGEFRACSDEMQTIPRRQMKQIVGMMKRCRDTTKLFASTVGTSLYILR